jgi:hypothetical protein
MIRTAMAMVVHIELAGRMRLGHRVEERKGPSGADRGSIRVGRKILWFVRSAPEVIPAPTPSTWSGPKRLHIS